MTLPVMRRIHFTRILLAVVATSIYCASIAPVSDALLAGLERSYPPVDPRVAPVAPAIVVLGGGIKRGGDPTSLPALHEGGSRYWYAARLFHAGKASLIIATGGNAKSSVPDKSEAAAIGEFLIDLGVPAQAILYESKSLTTVEDALLVKPILEAHRLSRVLLVTSAVHMPRALAIFRRAGIDAIPLSSDVEVDSTARYNWKDFVPRVRTLAATASALHEYLGLLSYPLQMTLARERLAQGG